MGSGELRDSGTLLVLAKIMMVVIASLVFVVVFVFFLHIYKNCFRTRRQEEDGNPYAAAVRQRFDFGGGYLEVNARRRGLDPSILKTIPVISFNTKDGLECSVCLSKVCDGEKARFLPKCNHGFHVDCVDKWFQSHSTCPLCRNLVSPTNNLFWGDENETTTTSTSSRPDGVLMIDIPT